MSAAVALFARMLRAGLNLDTWPTDVLERELERLLSIAGMELAPEGAAAALADALEHEGYERSERDYPPRDLARERADHERRQRVAGGTAGNAPAGLVSGTVGRQPRRDGETVTFLAPVVNLDDPHRGGQAASERARMHAHTLAVSAGRVPAPEGAVTTFEAPPTYSCPTCRHHHAPDTFCGEPLPVRHDGPPGAGDWPHTCQCDGNGRRSAPFI